MSDSDQILHPVEYAAPAQKPFSENHARIAKWAATVAPTVGVSILIAYGCTGWEPLVLAGIYWIYIGGGLAFVVGVTALVLYVLCRCDIESNRGARKQYGWALVWCILAVPAYIACMVGGFILFQYWHPTVD